MAKLRFLFLGLLITFTVNLWAQNEFQLSSQQADCDQAIDITGIDNIHATAPMGVGAIVEVHSSNMSLYAFSTEHNIVWYRFEVQQSCEMSFTITPDNPKDDYDFLLYRIKDNQNCQDIKKGELHPVRSNISRSSVTGETGLSINGASNFVHEGKGNNWSNTLVVKKGEVYYLVLDNVYKNGQGHRIKFSYSNCEEDMEFIDQQLSVNINVKDQESKRMVRGNILLIDESKGYKKYDTIYNKVSSSVFLPIEPGRYYECIVWAEGYLKTREIFKLDSNDKSLRLDIEMQPVAVGKTFELGDLYFEGGTARIIRKSYPALRSLLLIMKDSPSLRIEIQGHVNLTPNPKEKKSEEYYQELSVARALAVYDYLSKRGVEESRMIYIGFGYSKMIYPMPETTEQMQRNRRVVVKIIDIILVEYLVIIQLLVHFIYCMKPVFHQQKVIYLL